MKVICDRGALVESLNLVAGVVVSRTPKPVLTCVKMTATEEALSLAATDSEVSVELSTPRVEVSEAGEALIPADKLTQIVRESIDPTLTIAVEGDTAQITGQDSTFKVFGYPPGEFPVVPTFPGEPDFTLDAEELHRLVAMTLFATARENSRYAINGVLLERDSNKLNVVATDGHRLALAQGACKPTQAGKGNGQSADRGDDQPAASDGKGGENEPVAAIVPGKALHLLLRLFDDAEQTVRVKIAQNQIYFATDTASLASNLVEGNFPPYRDVIPKDGDKKATLATDVFISAVRRAALLTNEESKGVKLAFSSDGLTLSSRAPEMGEAEINVEVVDYSGDPVEIGFNPAYLLDALKVIEDNQVALEFKASNKPGVLRTGTNFQYVVMPVNLQ